jgi:transcriptional regulator with XRE-family HTH domain
MILKLEQPSDFPAETFRNVLRLQADFQQELTQYLSRAKPEEREFIQRILGCSEKVQSVVRSMFAVLESSEVTEEDRRRALMTIADALYLNPEQGHGSYGFDVAKIERQTASEHPEQHRRPMIASRLDELDSQQATFSERLRSILENKNITQEELAERIECTQSAISKMLTRNSRPQKNTILKMAAALDVSPTDLWPDLEVAAILDSIADFHQDRDLTAAQAAALDAAAERSPVKIKTRDLPSRKRK